MKGYLSITKFITSVLDKAEQPVKQTKPKADPRTKEIVDIFFKEYEKANGIKPDFGKAEGMHVKQLIKKLDELNESELPIQDLFRAVMQNLPDFYKSKSIRAINGNIKSIIAEIKQGRKGNGTNVSSKYDWRT